jgi:MFS family permease
MDVRKDPPAPPAAPPATDEPAQSAPWKHVGILVGAQLMLNLGISQVVPVLPYYATEAGGLSAAGLGLVLAMPSAARLIVNYPLGKLADTWGRKPLMVTGTVLTAVGIMGTGLAMPYGLLALVPFRLLVGIGSASSMVGSGAMVADLSDRAPAQRARIMGVQQAVISCAWAGGPAVGGLVAEAYGPLASFGAASAGTLLCSVGYACLPETVRSAAGAAGNSAAAAAHGDAGRLSSVPIASGLAGPSTSAVPALSAAAELRLSQSTRWRDILRSPDQRLLVAISAAGSISQAAFMAVVPLHLAQWGTGPASLGAVFAAVSAVYMLAMPLGSALADRSADKRLLVFGGMLASTLSFGTLVVAHSYESFLAVLVVSNVAAGLAGPAVGALMAETTPRAIRGQALSVHRSAADMFGLVSPIALGVIADAYSCPLAILASSAAMSGMVAVTGMESLAASRARLKAPPPA